MILFEEGKLAEGVGAKGDKSGPSDSSSKDESSNMILGGGGVIDRRRPAIIFDGRDLPFRVRMDVPQARTFFCFFFLLEDFLAPESDSAAGIVGLLSGSTTAAGDLSPEPFEPELCGLALLEVLEPVKGSRPKKDQRFGVFVGVDTEGSLESSWPRPIKRGIELRRRGDSASTGVVGILGMFSRTAPAVLGREKDFGADVTEPIRLPDSRSTTTAPPKEMMEEMLFVAECPPGRIVAYVLVVSVEISDRGRGMNSRVSENPTLARGPPFGGLSGSGSAVGGSSSGSAAIDSRGVVGSGLGLSSIWGSMAGGLNNGDVGLSATGLVGALLPRDELLLGFKIMVRSCCEIAAERRCWCPRFRAGGSVGFRRGEAKPLSGFVGLVLMIVIASPARSFPPTNSLAPRLWPWRPGGMCGDCGVFGGLSNELLLLLLLSSILAPGLKEKSGKAGERPGDRGCRPALSGAREAPGLKLNSGRPGEGLGLRSAPCWKISGNLSAGSNADLVRRPVALEYEDGADDGPCLPGKTN